MKRSIVILAIGALVLGSCASTKSAVGDYFALHGAILEDGPKGFVLTAPTVNSLVLRRIDPYTEEMRCEFTLQRATDEGPQNGFLVLVDQGDPEGVIVVGVYIGGQEYAIEGTGVTEPIRVRVEMDQARAFDLTVVVDFRKGYIELLTPEREIGTSLASHMKKVDTLGYHAKETITQFSEIMIVGR